MACVVWFVLVLWGSKVSSHTEHTDAVISIENERFESE